MKEEQGDAVPEIPPPTPDQMGHLVERLDKAVREYLAIGVSSSLRLTPRQMQTVLDWALQEARGEAQQMPAAGTAVEYFMTGLLEEITQVPSNTFEEAAFPDGTLRYVPLSPKVWQQCLEVYKRQLSGGQGEVKGQKSSGPKNKRR